jgi:diacylglycerol kinase (ATP)
MHEPKRFTIGRRLRSFVYAARGVRLMLVTQHNAWLHATATVIAIGCGWYFGITRSEWCWTVAALLAVWTAESLNTAFELMCDVTSPEFHPLVEQAKDVAAGAVLISAIGALAVGLLVFGPYFLALFG